MLTSLQLVQSLVTVTSRQLITITNIIIMKKLEILGELPKWDTETQSSQMLLENGTNRFSQCRMATKVQFVKKKLIYIKHKKAGVPLMAQRLANPTRIHEDGGSIPGLLSGLRILHCCELWCRSQTQLGF